MIPSGSAPAPDADEADLRLLVVDDEVQILELLDLTLTLHGFTVVTARSGPDALQAASGVTFDVVVMDVLMSPWDGFETVRRLHGLLGERLPPVVFLSGLSPAAPSVPLPAIVTEYLVKPFRPSQLVEVIRRVARTPS